MLGATFHEPQLERNVIRVGQGEAELRLREPAIREHPGPTLDVRIITHSPPFPLNAQCSAFSTRRLAAPICSLDVVGASLARLVPTRQQTRTEQAGARLCNSAYSATKVDRICRLTLRTPPKPLWPALLPASQIFAPDPNESK